MNRWTVVLVSMTLSGCATPPVAERADRLLADHLFVAASERISAHDVFAASDEMKHYVNEEIAGHLRTKGRQQGLIDALSTKTQLKLEYDSVVTRNAAQAFAARSGNCLSLVIMTAALAKELGLEIQYHRVLVDETWNRDGDIYFSIGHVNLTLGRRKTDAGVRGNEPDLTTIDFLPPQDVRKLRMWVIGEETIVAMYMNNRAAESLARGNLNDAYWWAREAIAQDPKFLSSYNTLGAIYQRHGNLEQAERVLTYALERDSGNLQVMSNLALVLGGLGRDTESRDLTRKLERLEPNPPFSYFNRGLAAMRGGDVASARDLFAKEVDRAGYYHEFQFWLAVAYAGLGELEQARKHLTIAMENSTTRGDHDLYAAKLERIKAYSSQ